MSVQESHIESNENAPVEEATAAPEPEPIEVIFESQCLSLSGRSELTYAIGRHAKDASLHLAITANSGGGMWCPDWANARAINELVVGSVELKAKSFHALHPGKSINTGGFVLAALKDMGLIRANEDNSRVHEHVPTTTFQQLVMARKSDTPVDPKQKAGKRKPREGST